MAASKKASIAKLRAIAAALQEKAAAESKGSQKVYISADQTATGRGVIRFREPRLLQSYKEGVGSRGQKSKSSKIRAAS